MTVSGNFPFSIHWLLDPRTLAMGEIIPHIGCWIKAYTTSWRTLPQTSRLPPPSWLCNCVFKGHYIFLSGWLLQNDGEQIRLVDSMFMANCHTSLAVKWVSWSEVVLCGIPWWWGRHPISSWVLVWGRSITGMMKQIHNQNKYLFQWGHGFILSTEEEVVQYTQVASRTLVGHPRKWIWPTSASVSRSVFMSEHPWGGAQAQSPSLPPWPIVRWLIQQWQEQVGK